MTIEDIVLDHDRRGISHLRPFLPLNFCSKAATTVLENPGTAMIVTGFHILAAKAPETDGPPGAVAIGNALRSIGYEIVYVTDQYSSSVLSGITNSDARIVEFPIVDCHKSQQFATLLLEKAKPSIIIAIERCGLTRDGSYLNMLGQEITDYNAKTDYLFSRQIPSIGIGDGGNEIGMGNVLTEITKIPTLVANPCVTKTTDLIISSVSNWGCYGLVAAISIQKGKNLLPSASNEENIIRRSVAHGAVDGITTLPEYKVDGFTLSENGLALNKMIDLLNAKGFVPNNNPQ